MSQKVLVNRVCERDDVEKLSKSCGIVRFRGVALTGSDDAGSDPFGDDSREQGSMREQKPHYPQNTESQSTSMGNRQNAP